MAFRAGIGGIARPETGTELGAGAAHQEKLRERSGGAQPGEKETQEGPSGSAQLPEGEGSQEMVGLCS